jgi:Rieske Fe-S protein
VSEEELCVSDSRCDVPCATGDGGASRRGVLQGAVAAGALALVPALAGCGREQAGSAGAPVARSREATAGQSLVDAAEVPVGGGIKLPELQLVVTQPTKGSYKAFDATCTHKQCQVADVSEGSINCRCHGSRFAIADGAVLEGPADAPLSEVQVKVTGSRVVRA